MIHLFPFEARVRQLPRDERGNVLLLSAMMAFLLTIMGLFALDTSQAVYNRIVAQNAADGAAEAAALWQARGLNLLQTLNNLHYLSNAALFAVECSELAACVAAPGELVTLTQSFDTCGPPPVGCFCCAVCPAAYSLQSTCQTCAQAGPTNDKQAQIANDILGIQGDISSLFPALAFFYANQVAYTAGADGILEVGSEYIQRIGSALLGQLGISWPSSTASLGSGLQAISDKLPAIYAFPLNPSSVSLDTQPVSGQNWPWKWNVFDVSEELVKFAACAAWEQAKYFSCPGGSVSDGVGCGYSMPDFEDHDSISSWGWDDQYYQGHPGFMTWMAGKTNQTELAGLGFLRWMNGNAYDSAAEVQYQLINQSDLPMYTGPIFTNTSLTIPPVFALASSQVEGTGVIAKDVNPFANFLSSFSRDEFGNIVGQILNYIDVLDLPPVDSAPRLTSVYLPSIPGSGSGFTPGSDMLIYH